MLCQTPEKKFFLSLQFHINFAVAIAIFLSIAIFCDVNLSLAQPSDEINLSKEYIYEDYIAQGYTKEEMEMLIHYATILGLARTCGWEPKEIDSVVKWIWKKSGEDGLPDLGIVFFDHLGNTLSIGI